jgi:DNA-binding transcriptional MerR regulator
VRSVPRTVGGAARETGYSVDTLRLLEKHGRVLPARDSANRRIYYDEHIAAIRRYRSERERRTRSASRLSLTVAKD